MTKLAPALTAAEVAPPAKKTYYPEPFASRVAGREKRALGDAFGLSNFGVNLTRLAPGSVSALRHWHTRQDEFVYILEGRPTLVTNAGRTSMWPGMCAGFKAGTGDAHHLVNETDFDVVYLEIGDRTPGDEFSYPDDDLKAVKTEGKWLACTRTEHHTSFEARLQRPQRTGAGTRAIALNAARTRISASTIASASCTGSGPRSRSTASSLSSGATGPKLSTASRIMRTPPRRSPFRYSSDRYRSSTPRPHRDLARLRRLGELYNRYPTSSEPS